MKNIFPLVLTLSGLCFLSGCGGGGAAPPPVTISNPPPTTPTITINNTAPPNGGLNLPFDFQFTVANGLPPFTWMETGALPAGLAFSPQGDLSGTPTASGSFPITVRVQDSLGQSAAPLAVTIQIFLHGFQATGDMGTGRVSHTATLLTNGKVLVAGGSNNSGNLATAELFDPATGTFTAIGTMTTARWSYTATLLAHGPASTNGKVLLAGGPGGNTAELFDPATGTFAATGSMTGPRSEHTATLLNNGKVLLAGGGGAPLTAELFDPATGTFTATGAMTQFRVAPTATLLNDGTVLITGGYDANLDSFATAELFNPATGTFTATAGAMTAARSEHIATLLNSGKVLVTGGIDSNGDILASAELFDPTTGSFSPTGALGSVHAFHTATLLNDGTVLVAGGFFFPNPPGDGSASAEVFDPTTNKFTPTGSLGTARYLHTATRLNNGQVLITGGLLKTNPSLVLNSAELYK